MLSNLVPNRTKELRQLTQQGLLLSSLSTLVANEVLAKKSPNKT